MLKASISHEDFQRRVGVEDEGTVCCYENIRLAGLGPGVPLLFGFTRNSIIFLVLLGVTFVGFALYSNIASGYCKALDDNCSNNFLDSFSIFNKAKNDDFLAIQNYTVLTFCILSVVFLQYFRYNFRRIEDECDEMINTPSDYAIILRRLPDGTTKRDIEYMIENRRIGLNEEQILKTENLKVDHIVMSYSMTEYNKIKDENEEQFHRFLSEQRHVEFVPKVLPKLNKTASLAIVIFTKQESKQYFRYKANILQNILQCFVSVCVPLSNFEVRGQRIAVQRAPEPDDIIWRNSKISMGGAMIRKLIYNSLAILLLGSGFSVQYGLAVAKNKISQEQTEQLIMSSVFSITVSILNAVIQIFLGLTSRKQRTETLTQFNNILMVKISVFQFLNTGVFVVLAQFLANMDNFSLNGGIVFEITQVMLLNAILPNVTLFILSYFQLFGKVERYLIKSQFIKRSQLEANQSFEGPPVEFPFKYAYVFKTLWLSAFYAPISPVIVPISILGLILNYFLQKFLFSSSYAAPTMTSSIINDSAVEMMQYAVLALPIGSYIIYLYFYSFHPQSLPDYWSIPLYVSMGVAVLNLMLPMDSLNKKLFKIRKDYEVSPSYQQVQDKFEVTYEMTNPGYVCKKRRKGDGVGCFKEVPLVEISGVRLLANNNNIQGVLLEEQNEIYGDQNNNQRSVTKRQNENQSNSFMIVSNEAQNECKDKCLRDETNKVNEIRKLQGMAPKFDENNKNKNECNISIIVQNQNNEIIMQNSFQDEYGIVDDGKTIWYNLRNENGKSQQGNSLKNGKNGENQQENEQKKQKLQIIQQQQIQNENEYKKVEIRNDFQITNTNKNIEIIEQKQMKLQTISLSIQQQIIDQVKKLKERQEIMNQNQNIVNCTQIIEQLEQNKFVGKIVEQPQTAINSVSDHNSEKIEKNKLPINLVNFQNIDEILLEEEWISQRSQKIEQNEKDINFDKLFLVNGNQNSFPNQNMPVPICHLLSKEAFELIHKKQQKNNGTQQNNDEKQTEIQSTDKNIKNSNKKPSFFSSKFKQFIWKPPSENVEFDFNDQINLKTQFDGLINVVQPPPVSIMKQSEDYTNSRERRKALRMQNMKKLPFTNIIFKKY